MEPLCRSPWDRVGTPPPTDSHTGSGSTRLQQANGCRDLNQAVSSELYVGPFPQVPRFPQPAFHTIRLDVLEALPPSTPGRAAVTALLQKVFAPHRTMHETAAWGPPSLSMVWNFRIDPVRQWPRRPFHALSTAPSLHRRCFPPSPPCRPGLPLPGSRLMCALPPGRGCLSSPSMRASVNTEADRCPLSLSSPSANGLPLNSGWVGFRPFSRPLDVSRSGPHGAPLTPECFRYLPPFRSESQLR